MENDPTFAMAGLALARTADQVNALSDLSRGLTTAWQYRAELIERDRIYLEGLAGPRYPAPSGDRERLLAWERVVAATPDRAEAWVGSVAAFYKEGCLELGTRLNRRLASFERARELDDALVSRSNSSFSLRRIRVISGCADHGQHYASSTDSDLSASCAGGRP